MTGKGTIHIFNVKAAMIKTYHSGATEQIMMLEHIVTISRYDRESDKWHCYGMAGLLECDCSLRRHFAGIFG